MNEFLTEVKEMFSDFKASFFGLFTVAFLRSVITPKVELARFFYWGLILYTFVNFWMADVWALLCVGVTVFLIQIILKVKSNREFSVQDYLFAFLPALIVSLHIWI